MSIANELEREMLELINQERRAAGLSDLQLEQRLNESSEDHSQWMLAQDIFSHTGAGGSSSNARMVAASFDFSGSWRSGENIGMQSIRGAAGYSDDVEDIHDRLMNSAGHRANILNTNYDYIGIGIEIGDYKGYTVVMITQNFASTGGQVVLDNGSALSIPLPFTGTGANDVLRGTHSDDVISGMAGNDVLIAAGGADTLQGGDGNDVLRGGQGADLLDGGQGYDNADYRTAATGVSIDLAVPSSNTGEARGDIYLSIEGAIGSRHDDYIRGDASSNRINGWAGNDRIEGRAGNDTILGAGGNDTIEGGQGDDMLFGGNGADRIEGNAGRDRLFGNGGSDTFVFAPGMGVDVVVDFENNIDVLDFQAFNFNNTSQLTARAEARAADLFFNLGDGDALLIKNATLAQVADDFLI